jgi:hypothetical protein
MNEIHNTRSPIFNWLELFPSFSSFSRRIPVTSMYPSRTYTLLLLPFTNLICDYSGCRCYLTYSHTLTRTYTHTLSLSHTHTHRHTHTHTHTHTDTHTFTQVASTPEGTVTLGVTHFFAKKMLQVITFAFKQQKRAARLAPEGLIPITSCHLHTTQKLLELMRRNGCSVNF